MAKATKEFEWRMQGMLYAHKIVKEQGVEALDKEIKMRGRLKLDIWVTNERFSQLSGNLYCSILCTMLYAIHDLFGFGEKRLKRLKKHFDKLAWDIQNLDYLCEHYVRFEDYAVYLNDRYHMDLDADRMAALQDIADDQDIKSERNGIDVGVRV